MRIELISHIMITFLFALSVVGMSADEFLPNKSIHWPSDGDKVTKIHYDYCESVSDSLSIWDFSGAVETGQFHIMRWTNIGDSILVKKELGTQLTYNVKNDAIVLRAYENPLLELRDSIPIPFGPKYGTAKCSAVPFSFNGFYCKNNFVSYKGVITTEISDTGILILPNDTIEDVVKVKQKADGEMLVSSGKYSVLKNDSVSASKILNHVAVMERWYPPSFRYELVENVSDRYFFNGKIVRESSATFICPPEEQESSLNMACKTDPSIKNTYSTIELRPKEHRMENHLDGLVEDLLIDFDGTVISVKITGQTDIKAGKAFGVLCDQLGRVWETFSEIDFVDGIWQAQIPLNGLPQGNYIFHLSVGGVSISKKLIIQ